MAKLEGVALLRDGVAARVDGVSAAPREQLDELRLAKRPRDGSEKVRMPLLAGAAASDGVVGVEEPSSHAILPLLLL